MKRGWTSQELAAVGDDDTLWTIIEAAQHLGPLPGDPDQMPVIAIVTKLRILARFHHLEPVGKRRTTPVGTPGRFARVYRAIDFINLYAMMDFDNDEKPPIAA